MRSLSVLFILMFVSLSALGQSVITGRVVSKSNNDAVPSVSVSLTDATTKKVIGGGFTNKEGRFSIPISEALLSQKVTLSFSHLAYQKIALTETAGDLRGRTFTLSSREEQLKEVVVRATAVRKRGDTIRYSVGQLIKLGDHTLEDAIKRIPGMQVGKDGKISYEGKSINKFYIEGLDLMGGKYGLATKNIKADDVAAVEVLENHEPIKMRKERSLSDQAALNIRMKESAKNTWIYSLTTGAGINKDKKPLYLGDGSAYTFGKSNQLMAIGKGTNNGANIFSELNTLALDEIVSRERFEISSRSDFFDTSADIGDEVVRERGRINTTALGSLNFIHKISEDAKWRINAGYGFDRAERMLDETKLFRISPTETAKIEDHTSLFRREHRGEVESNYTFNGNNTFVKVQTEGKLYHKDLKADRSTNGNPYSEHTVAPSGTLSNVVSWSKKHGKNILTISDALWLDHMPQQLSLHAASPLPGNTDKIIQDATTSSVANDVKVGYEFYAGRLELLSDVKLKYKREHFDTKLHFPHLDNGAIPLRGDMVFSNLVLEVSPWITYRLKKWRMSLMPEIMISDTRMTEKEVADGKMSRRKVWFNPHVGLSYQGSSFDWDMSVRYGENDRSALDHYSPYIFRGVGSISTGIRDWWQDQNLSAFSRMTYKDIFNFFSAVYTASFRDFSTPISTETRLRDIYLIRGFVPMAHKGTNFSQSLDLQKIFQPIGLTTHLSLKHGLSALDTHQQGRLYRSISQSINLSPTIEWQIASGFSMKYAGDISRSFFRLKEEKSYRPQDTQVHTVSFFAKPVSGLLLNARGKLFYNKSPLVNDGEAHKFYVFDATAEWTLPWATLILSANNIGGSSRYHLERQSSLNAYSAQYYLRPSEIFLTFRWKFNTKKN